MKKYTTYIIIKHTTTLKPEVDDIVGLRQSISAKLTGYQSKVPLVFLKGDVEIKFKSNIFSKLWFTLWYYKLKGFFTTLTVTLKLKKETVAQSHSQSHLILEEEEEEKNGENNNI